ncbi:XRE family transcriptional regulator [Fodinicola acaciae]|uniref:XRE family transcriptional regulator n=1 Tax=Fodinicola acaciae TaxID=2681555 RepID=UPI0013D38AB8|nr:XRE family transcriptional regulator [Fodinicola acaciae]
MTGYDPIEVPPEFWEDPRVLAALKAKHVGRLFAVLTRWPYTFTQTRVGTAVGMQQPLVSKYIREVHQAKEMHVFRRIADGLEMPAHARALFGLSDDGEDGRGSAIVVRPPAVPIVPADLDQVEQLRQALDAALHDGAMAEASLEDWERTVSRYGRATRDRSADLLFNDLTTDLTDLQTALTRYRSASALRHLTRVTAQLSGLICLTLVKMDNRIAFRRWARTARHAASEAGDPLTTSWVLAQEAYGHYYSGDLIEALSVAEQAQVLAGKSAAVGAPLAAALEARVYGMMGRRAETQAALHRAEEGVSRLEGDALAASAFGYNESQLRFHEGNAYTHLRDSDSARVAQERALELCAPGDFTDWAITRLDRANCLVYDGDTAEAMSYATETFEQLSTSQREGIITLRGQEILTDVPAKDRLSAPVQQFKELLMLTSQPKKEKR